MDKQVPVTIGSLCTGYGGLDMAVESVLGGELAWYSEYEPPTEKRPRPSRAAATLLAYRYPGVPNLGDMTKIDWSLVPSVDAITGGTPCQDVSHAGARRGMRAGTRSGIWASMVDAIDALRPGLVFWENVRGVTYAEADSDVEPCPLCMGDGTGDALRALGRVLGDLADIGYDARWVGFPASAVGAPHDRFRVFLVAHPSGSGWDAGPAALGGDGAQADVAGRGAAVANPDGQGPQSSIRVGPQAAQPEPVGTAGSTPDEPATGRRGGRTSGAARGT
jgi:DNA (cytosine-5)-methyltransferase 1